MMNLRCHYSLPNVPNGDELGDRRRRLLLTLRVGVAPTSSTHSVAPDSRSKLPTRTATSPDIPRSSGRTLAVHARTISQRIVAVMKSGQDPNSEIRGPGRPSVTEKTSPAASTAPNSEQTRLTLPLLRLWNSALAMILNQLPARRRDSGKVTLLPGHRTWGPQENTSVGFP